MNFRIILYLISLVLFNLGCSEPETLEYVVPDNFKGIVRIQSMQDGGISVKPTNNVITLTIPKSGIIKIKSRLSSEKWHYPTARYKSGKMITVVTSGSGNPAEIAFRSVGSLDDKEEWFVVGTFDDLKAAKEEKDGFKWPSN